MKVTQKENITIIKDTQNDLVSFKQKLNHEHKSFEKLNLIIDISLHKDLKVKDINDFLLLSNLNKKNKKSFVIVAENIDFNKVSDKINVVPTVQEAHDIIEMDEIERDLGF